MKKEIQELLPGTIIDNQKLCEIFRCAPQGGIRRSHNTNTLAPISSRSGIYRDRQDGEIYHCTGMAL